MDNSDTHVGHVDWTTTGDLSPTSTRVVIQSGRFAGVEGELVLPLTSQRALVRVRRGVLLEIDTAIISIG